MKNNKTYKPYMRKHRNSWVIEQKVNGRSKHLCSTNVIEILNLKGVQFIEPIAYKSTKGKRKVNREKFAHDILGELSKEPKRTIKVKKQEDGRTFLVPAEDLSTEDMSNYLHELSK